MHYKFNVLLLIDSLGSLVANVELLDVQETEYKNRNSILM